MVWLIALCVLLLAGCSCEHEWKEADCITPKTCSLCQETEGSPLGHSWLAATCTAPKTCEICQQTEGEPLGHNWEEATCVTPKKCTRCHETEGTAMEHDWEDATTETPKTCKNCQKTEGERIITDPRFTTESTKDLYGKWSCHVDIPGEMIEVEDYFETISATLYYEFKNNGDLIMTLELDDAFAFLEGMKQMMADAMYAEGASYGYGKAATDQIMQETYGMTVEELVNESVESIDLDELFSFFTQDGVYYVGQNGIYQALSWMNEFECSEYTLEDGVLIIEEDVMEEGGEPFQWRRVEE